jgi:hypothetical protein
MYSYQKLSVIAGKSKDTAPMKKPTKCFRKIVAPVMRGLYRNRGKSWIASEVKNKSIPNPSGTSVV